MQWVLVCVQSPVRRTHLCIMRHPSRECKHLRNASLHRTTAKSYINIWLEPCGPRSNNTALWLHVLMGPNGFSCNNTNTVHLICCFLVLVFVDVSLDEKILSVREKTNDWCLLTIIMLMMNDDDVIEAIMTTMAYYGQTSQLWFRIKLGFCFDFSCECVTVMLGGIDTL